MSKKSPKKRRRQRKRRLKQQQQQQQQQQESTRRNLFNDSQQSSSPSTSSSLLPQQPQTPKQQTSSKSQNQTTSIQETNHSSSFGTRKRSLAAVTFVYPSNPQGTKPVPFHFGKRLNDNRIEEEDTPKEIQQPAIRRSDETIDDILFPSPKLNTPENHAKAQAPFDSATAKRARKESFEETKGQRKQDKEMQATPAETQKPTLRDANMLASTRDEPDSDALDATRKQLETETTKESSVKKHKASANEPERVAKRPRRESIDDGGEAMGILSGLSVEQAIRDKKGCRPRSNSTDGELNLPRRGLCDEREVLLSYQWNFRKLNNIHSWPCGFVNLGNTCFLNSILQCLAYLPPFCQSLMSMPTIEQNGVKRKITQGKKITIMLRTLFGRVHGSNGETAARIAPRAIVKAVPSLGCCGSRNGYKFRPGRQEDAHEFLLHLLDAMNDGELREAGINQHVSGWRNRLPIPRLDETTFIHRIFGGYLRSQIRCTSCGYRSNTYDPFLDLSLEVSQQSCLSVHNALHEFTRKETLDSENRWKCSGCKKRVCATKQLTVFRPPLSLCIQLKRFAYSGSMGLGGFGGYGFGNYNGFGMGRGGKKISKPIDFPSHLKLALSDGRSCGYALTGVVVHVGGSASSGHYTAYVKKPGSQGDDRWFYTDDSAVEAVSERTVLRQKDAYILFYSREEVKLEFPTPPLRASMSAEEAKEFGRARARARADSLSESHTPAMRPKTVGLSPSSNTFNLGDAKVPCKTPQKEDFIGPLPKDTTSEHSSGGSSADWARAFKKGSPGSLCVSESASSPATSVRTGDGTTSSASSKAHYSNTLESPSVASEYSSRATELDSASKASKSTRGGTSESDSESESSGSSEASCDKSLMGPKKRISSPTHTDESSGSKDSPLPDINTSSPTNSERESSDDEGSDKESPLWSTGHENITQSSSRDEATDGESSSLQESSTSSGSSTSDTSSPASTPQSGKDNSTPLSTPLTPQGDAQTNYTPSGSQDSKSSRTRIVVDRGEGRGKVEVMMGPRFKSKAWTPKASVGKKGQGYELLGNLAVEKWDDDDSQDAMQTPTNRRSELVKVLEREEKSRKSKMYVDRWDATLDQGKKRKVKSRTASDAPSSADPQKNAFQRIQTGLQRMNCGRPKGSFRQDKQHKKNGKNRK